MFTDFLRKGSFLCCLVLTVCNSNAQKNGYDFSFYGFIRGEIYANSRSNVEGVDGLFYLYPKDVDMNSDDKDLNAVANGSFYTFATRFGLDIKGPDVGAAKATAKVETDFGGTNNMNFLLRIRQIYLKLAWESGSALLLGQTWHPMFGDVIPTVLNLSTGSPFQPFNRSPQINYQYSTQHFRLTAAAIYQLVYLTQGAAGKSEEYQKNTALPELFLGADYRSDAFLFGAGAEMLTIRPRTTYGLNERLTSFSYQLHAKYTYDLLQIACKTILAENQTHNTMLGGFGVTSTDNSTYKQEYTPFRHSTSWLNIVLGKKYQGSLFAGYTKNLGTSESLESKQKIYGMGLDIDRLLTLNLCGSYNLPHWKAGIEYTYSTAWYGTLSLDNGRVTDTHAANNHRLEAIFMYYF